MELTKRKVVKVITKNYPTLALMTAQAMASG